MDFRFGFFRLHEIKLMRRIVVFHFQTKHMFISLKSVKKHGCDIIPILILNINPTHEISECNECNACNETFEYCVNLENFASY